MVTVPGIYYNFTRADALPYVASLGKPFFVERSFVERLYKAASVCNEHRYGGYFFYFSFEFIQCTMFITDSIQTISYSTKNL